MKMMKKTLLLIVGCLMCGKMHAQHQQLFDEYRRKAGDQAEMFVGKVEPGYPPTVYNNHPYCARIVSIIIKSDLSILYHFLFFGNREEKELFRTKKELLKSL